LNIIGINLYLFPQLSSEWNSTNNWHCVH